MPNSAGAIRLTGIEAIPNSAVWTLASLTALDRAYEGMYRRHEHCHEGLIAELGELRRREESSTVLEIACGTGWNIENLVNSGFVYCGMDLSETAIAVSMIKYPICRFVNCAIEDADFIADGSFDIVLSASMLEHLQDFRPALHQMLRIARRDLFVIFFEGLKENGEDEINTYPFDSAVYANFGVKFAALQESYGGKYFWNRYTVGSIHRSAHEAGAMTVEFFTARNRPYLKSETILHVTK